MVVLSALFGILAGIIGTAISSAGTNLSTGPVIVLVAVSIVLFSFLFAPERGWLAKWILTVRNRKNLVVDKLFYQWCKISDQHDDIKCMHELSMLKPLEGYNQLSMMKLQENGLIVIDNNEWCLTDKGIAKATSLLNSGGDEI